MPKQNIIAGLDIGSSKISVVVGNTLQGSTEKIGVIGVGHARSEGLRAGVVVDINQTAEAIRKAIANAELMAGVKIDSVCVGISGEHIIGQTSHGVVSVANNEISHDDVDRAMIAAKAISIPADREILHVIQQNFVVDAQDRIREPIGMSGARLEAYAYIITGGTTAIQNLLNSIEKAGVPIVETLVAAPLAATQAIVSKDEREVGIALVDIGDGTTEIVIYKEDSIQHTAVVPVGGQHVTNDIAQYLKVTLPEAEDLKLHRGCAWTELVDPDEVRSIPVTSESTPPRFIDRVELAQIIEYRMVEILEVIGYELGDIPLPGGLVLTGGTALMDGLQELAEAVLQLRVQIGYPRGLQGLTDRVNHPMYATGIGLALYGESLRRQEEEHDARHRDSGVGNFLQRIKEWFGY
ncbi:cell division protein FtsA [Candidatus Poribacteria bacterium]|nr:cell division protein FtsA [Candidatus Poribacteria bacterium]MYH81132.1 cell division protein FtsA [Candidatus Poribacteria bacterium]MYK92562.1 cell division protein FtsA [Candidatus Poribacteria bacterium]